MELKSQTQNENIVAGIVGALLFSLGGALIYFFLYQLGFLASIAGLVGTILAIKGYSLFAKKESVRGVIIASVISIFVILITWYFSFSFVIFQASQEWFANGEIDFQPTFVDCFYSVPAYFLDPESRAACISDIAFTLIFTLIGPISTIITTARNIKARQRVPKENVPFDANLTTDTNEFKAPEESANSSAILRSADTTEKIKVFVEADAWGHHVIYRKVGKKTEELVIDGSVYAEFQLKGIVKAHSMSAIVNGHNFTVGMYQSNFIQVDGITIATSIRWA